MPIELDSIATATYGGLGSRQPTRLPLSCNSIISQKPTFWVPPANKRFSAFAYSILERRLLELVCGLNSVGYHYYITKNRLAVGDGFLLNISFADTLHILLYSIISHYSPFFLRSVKSTSGFGAVITDSIFCLGCP